MGSHLQKRNSERRSFHTGLFGRFLRCIAYNTPQFHLTRQRIQTVDAWVWVRMRFVWAQSAEYIGLPVGEILRLTHTHMSRQRKGISPLRARFPIPGIQFVHIKVYA